MDGNVIIFILVGLFSLSALIYITKNEVKTNTQFITYAVLIGGILGNLIDRIIYGYVIDFLEFKIFNYPFPVFNFADICIVLAVIFLSLEIIVGEINERNNKYSK